ncbi:type IV secretory system conjugative DNA transfer family protein [Pseudomarimonas arenosa]|nr:type IV secretory system conjugative DNA transfer family protein [Pseudomarimonas arenosa]
MNPSSRRAQALSIALLGCTIAANCEALPSSILPQHFNPNTCEQEQAKTLNGERGSDYRYETYSCDQLRKAYQWEPLQRAVLVAQNGIPNPEANLNDSAARRRTDAALASLAESASRITNDFERPPQEKRDLLGEYLNWSQKLYAERGWDVPQSIPEVFTALRARLSKPYVDPTEQRKILLTASERASALFLLTNEAARVSIVDSGAPATHRAYAAAKQAETSAIASESHFDGVKRRAEKIQGVGKLLLETALMVGLVVLIFRRALPTNRARLIAFCAGTCSVFLAQLSGGIVQVLTGIPTWATFALALVIFGVLYVLFRDKLQGYFGGVSQLATHGSAAWSRLHDALNANRIFRRGFVSADSYGFALGRFPGATSDLDPRLRYMGHVLTCAPTGCGKGVGAVIPALLEYPGSALVLDIKGENYAVTASARSAMGHAVHLVDPFGVIAGGGSASFNPLDALDLAKPDVVGQVSALVDTLVVVGANQDDNSAHFNDSARELVKGLIVYVRSLPEPERRTLGEVRRLLTLPLTTPAESDRESLLAHLSDMSADDALAFGVPARCANGFLSKEPKEASGVLSTALRHTAFLDDPRVAAALSRSDFEFADLKRQPMTVYVVMPPDRLTAQSRFLRALVGAALSAITANSDRPQYNVLFLLDEFAQLGRMQSIEDAISLVRGYGARFWLLVQDLSQLKGVYPKWQTFLANSAKQFFGTADYETAKYVSDMLGQSTIEFRTLGDSSTASLQGGSSGNSTSQQLTARSLLTPDEVMRLGAERPIVLVQGERPYSLERINYLSDDEYAGLADTNPFHQ